MFDASLRSLLYSCTCLVTILSVVGEASAETPAATLLFSTACADCDKGEFSGRLTFLPEASGPTSETATR